MDEFKYQLSVTIPSGEQFEKGHMLNVRANTADEFTEALNAVRESSMAQAIAEAVGTVKAAAVAAGVVVAAPQAQPTQGGAQRPAQAPARAQSGGPDEAQATQPSSGSAPECAHGTKLYSTGTVKTGKNAGKGWKAWDCPAKKCDREWIN